jgi:CHAT domain-containing protein/tetratricopeptide (TPR) repeat protein
MAPTKDQAQPPSLNDILDEFLRLPVWGGVRRLLEQHPILLSDEVDFLMDRLDEAEKESGVDQEVGVHHDLLRRCRAVGLDDAFAELSPTPVEVHGRGTQFLGKFISDGDPQDLNRALNWLNAAATQLSLTSPEIGEYIAHVGQVWHRRFLQARDLEDLNGAIRYIEEACQLGLSEIQLAPVRTQLGLLLLTRYRETVDAQDIDHAIANFEMTLRAKRSGDSDHALALHNLATALVAKAESSGDPIILGNAIDFLGQAASSAMSAGDSDFAATARGSLGGALVVRYQLTGASEDLEQAIEILDQAVGGGQTATSQSDSSQGDPAALNALGLALWERYQRTLRKNDLKRASDVLQDAIQAASPSSPLWAAMHNNLGLVLATASKVTSKANLLDQAIQVYGTALDCLSADADLVPRVLNNLADAFAQSYMMKKDLGDLTHAINVCELAVAKVGNDPLKQALCLNNLAKVLYFRHQEADAGGDLDAAIQALTRAIEGMPSKAAYLPVYLENLGDLFLRRYQCSRRAEELQDLRQAILYWERARTTLRAASVATPVTYKIGQQIEGVGLYAKLVHAYLEEADVRPANRAEAVRAAMIVAEASKARLLTELIGQKDIPAAEEIPPDLVERERVLVAELTAADTAELGTQTSANTNLQSGDALRAEARRKIADELGSIWSTMEAIGPEAADYVSLRRGRSLSWNDLQQEASEVGKETALISLFASNAGTALFILRTGWEAPEVTRQEELTPHAWFNLLSVLREDIVAGRVIKPDRCRHVGALLHKAAPHLKGTKKLVLSLEAYAHHLPWALLIDLAGVFQPRKPSLATLPTLGLLGSRRRRVLTTNRSALVVGNPTGDLEFAEAEATAVAAILGTTPLLREKATATEVLARVADAWIIHLATHARFVPRSPLSSCIQLADSSLTAKELMSCKTKANVMTLSSCESGLGSTLGGEELVGLAFAALHGGARAFIASLWKVDDQSTAFLMAELYRRIVREEEEVASALHNAQLWLRALDRDAVDQLLEDAISQASSAPMPSGGNVQSIVDHLQAQRKELRKRLRPGDHPFDEPYHWAGFTISGTG